jgi:hypothetical protein
MVRKRASGGGRKPKGSAPGAPLTIRMPPDLRAALDAAARKRDRYLSEEILGRLRRSLAREREEARDPAFRAFCFLFSEIANAICAAPKNHPGWQFDPWSYRVFKLAVRKILDHFEPAGEMRVPELWRLLPEIFENVAPPKQRDLMKKKFTQTTESPGKMADFLANRVLESFSDPLLGRTQYHFYSTESGKKIEIELTKEMTEGDETSYYGMIDARRDLASRRKPQGEKS